MQKASAIRSSPTRTFLLGQTWYDNYVWKSDFVDPDRVSGGADSSFFDKPGTAISYFAGHGALPAGNVWQYCYSAAGCSAYSPPSGATDPRFCRTHPGQGFGLCTYHSYDRRIVTAQDTGCQLADYSNGSTKWGESQQSGAWAGAGTNGGANVVVLSKSFGHNSQRTREVWPAFAGIHMLLTPLNHTGDVLDRSERGYWFAYFHFLYPYKSVVQAWIESGGMIPVNYPSECCGVGSAWESCGWGYNFCGGHIAAMLDDAANSSLVHYYENWDDIRNDAWDGRGASHWRNFYLCNWRCDLTGFQY